MDEQQLNEIRRTLEAKGVTLATGLSEEELAGIEVDFGFRFPPDLRALLHAFLPAGTDWPDWRGGRQRLLEWLDVPADGIEFDVEESDFWFEGWGERPDDIDDAVEDARRHVALAPMLIPLHGNDFLPARPVESGNPVFEVEGSGVRVAARDLASWFREASAGVGKVRRIELWSDLVSE
jgi:hypothetical protein